MSADRHKVVVVDDHVLVREGLVQVLERGGAYTVCAQAGNISDALDAVEDSQPDLVLVDLMLSGQDGLELVKTISARWAALPVLVISVRDEVLYAERALRAGASGYLMKGSPTAEVLVAAEVALSGEIYLSRQMNSRLLGRLLAGNGAGKDDQVDCLSDRELYVFQLTGAGLTPRDIAKRLGLSVRTVETHRDNIRHKLQLKSAAAVVRFATHWVEQAGG